MKDKIMNMIIIVLCLSILLVGLFTYKLIYSNTTSETTIDIINKNDDGSYNMTIDMSKWSYDSEHNVYYQLGIVYCENPVDTNYESLGIYIPGDYMTVISKNGETYECKINTSTSINGYNANNAPIVIPINTPGYSACLAPTTYQYQKISSYMNAGYIYVEAGCRGKYDNTHTSNSGAPWGITDLKAAIRFIKYNESLPGDNNRIFTFGHSGGGAQSAIIGASGDSELYDSYLDSIGAIMKNDAGEEISDSVCGSMCWCPITSLDSANAAYEWNMGQYVRTDTLSVLLTNSYLEYINNLQLKNGNETLKLTDTNKGSYYDYVLQLLEESLENYLTDTYTNENDKLSYINSLNSDETWVTYNSTTQKVTFKSIASFVTHCKQVNKSVGAFDSLERNATENYVFGIDNSQSLHFDQFLYQIIKNDENYSSYVKDFENDFESVDSLGVDTLTRLQMYNPMYYLTSYYDGYETSKIASYWRINSGITQGDTANVTEINLSLALKMNKNVKDVDFTTVWNQGHTEAERSGTSTENFINWIDSCLK